MKFLWFLLQCTAFLRNCSAAYCGLNSPLFGGSNDGTKNRFGLLRVVRQAQTKDAVSRFDDDNEPSQEVVEPRQLCNSCHRPLIQCLCDHLPPTKISLDTNILVLQHPVEFRRKTVSTTPLLKLVLEHVQVLVGRSFDHPLEAVLQNAVREGRTPLVLFPGPNATNLEDPIAIEELLVQTTRNSNQSQENITMSKSSQAETNKLLLIIVDGTWTQASRMVRYSPLLLEQCIAVQFTGTDDPSIYDSIRKQPAKHCLSTLESCCRALNLLEPNTNTSEATDYLLSALKALVTTQIDQERKSLAKNPGSIRNVQKLEFKRQRQTEIETSLNISLTAENNVVSPSSGYTKDLDNGFILRSLKATDASFVDSRWPFQSNKSLKMIERQITADHRNGTQIGIHCCWGIEYKQELVACIIRHRNSSIGILHVEEEFRRRGFGAILLRQATESTQKRGEAPVAFIMDGNRQSEALFSSLGWVKADPLAKKGTGKRKAKRKWVYKS